jgi:hypothetical protein
MVAYKYNYRNPVKAGICTGVEDYQYSSFYFVHRNKELKFKLCEDLTYGSDPVETLNWLNTAPTPEKLEAARYGFKRQYFKSKIDRKTRKPILKENEVF